MGAPRSDPRYQAPAKRSLYSGPQSQSQPTVPSYMTREKVVPGNGNRPSYVQVTTARGTQRNMAPAPHTAVYSSLTEKQTISSGSASGSGSGSSSQKYAVGLVPAFTDDPEDDDDLHNWRDEGSSHACSGRGLCNMLTLILLALGLVALFAGYPIVINVEKIFANSHKGAFNIGGTNGSGQRPDLPIFSLIDPDTPQSAMTRVSRADGKSYHLVFSDEFQLDGRTFWPDDDPFWEAVDIYYGSTGDYEWYSPEAVNTTGGYLNIHLEEKVTHNLNFQSGMVQSWNKFCFQGGYIEFSMRQPGSPSTSGYWPGLWLMGNLARPGYMGSTDGMWPYSYQGCDAGILRNQTWLNETGPYDAINSKGTFALKSGQISQLSGMRWPACTCDGQGHPGPNPKVARSSPELDVLEATVRRMPDGWAGYASQSYQIAPFDVDYYWNNGSEAVTIWDTDTTELNSYKGNTYQEAVSGLARIPDRGYVGTDNEFVTFGVEYQPDWNADGTGSITWYIDGKPTWTVTGAAMPGNPTMDISRRTISVEPMSIVMNLAVSPDFQHVDFSANGITFPATMSVDYVRVYQLDGEEDRISCDPPDHPTAKYIQNNLDLYYNPNHTVYPYDWPKNRLTGC